MAPLKDEHGIDGAEDYPEDEGDYGEEGGSEEDSGEEGAGEEGSGEEESTGEGTGEEGAGEEGYEEGPADEGEGGEPEAQPEEPEVHEVSAERPRRPRHGRRGRRRRRRLEERRASKKRMYTIVAIVVVLLLASGAWFFWGPAGSIAKIDLIARTYREDVTNVSGMALLAVIDAGKPSSLSGTADLKISYNNTRVYSGQMEVSGSKATRNLPYGQFAVGNGDYGVEFLFQGFTASATFTVTEIIERMNITAHCITNFNNATLVPPGSARIGFTVTFLNGNEVAQRATDKDSLEVEIIRGGAPDKHTENIVSQTQVNNNYPVPGNGNYTVRATFHNSKVKPGTRYSTIEAIAVDYITKDPYVIVLVPPLANAGADKTAQWKLADGGATVSFDGTASVAYEGATITLYSWDYGDFTGEEGAKTTHLYTDTPGPGQPLKYVAKLTVADSNGQYSTDTVEVTITV